MTCTTTTSAGRESLKFKTEARSQNVRNLVGRRVARRLRGPTPWTGLIAGWINTCTSS
jgi:hypothetical protein